MAKFTRAKDGRSAKNLGASFDVSAFTPELPRGFYDDGVRLPPYPDNQRCTHVRNLVYSKQARRCGHPRLVRDVCFYHCTDEERVQYQAQRDAKKLKKKREEGLL